MNFSNATSSYFPISMIEGWELLPGMGPYSRRRLMIILCVGWALNRVIKVSALITLRTRFLAALDDFLILFKLLM